MCFYDTVIFQLSINSNDPDFCHCERLLDDSCVSWKIVWSEISLAESSMEEYFEQLEMRLSLSGIDYEIVKHSQIRTQKRSLRRDLRKLSRLGVGPRDRSQVAAATFASCANLITRDQDFIDPKNKARSAAGKKTTAVKDYLKDELDLVVLFPEDAALALQ